MKKTIDANHPRRVQANASHGALSSDVPTVTSRALLGPGRRLRITHGEQTYVLTITRQNKLILTK